MTLFIGSQPRLRVTFRLEGIPTDPTAVSFFIKSPGDSAVEYVYGTDSEVVKESTGVYYMDVPLDESGRWDYRIVSTGTVVAAYEDHFFVEESLFI